MRGQFNRLYTGVCRDVSRMVQISRTAITPSKRVKERGVSRCRQRCVSRDGTHPSCSGRTGTTSTSTPSLTLSLPSPHYTCRDITLLPNNQDLLGSKLMPGTRGLDSHLLSSTSQLPLWGNHWHLLYFAQTTTNGATTDEGAAQVCP